MKYNIFSYLIGEGFRNVWKQKKSTGASLVIMCATMIIFGIFFLAGENINNMMKDLESQQGMRVFIEKEATEENITKLGDTIKALDGVNKVEFISEEDALKDVKEQLDDKQYLIEGYDTDNPFRASYVVTLTDLSKSEQVKSEIEEMEFVGRVSSRDTTISALMSVTHGINIISWTILVLLIVISTFIISNTIKLTVHARRKEISIMKYVGATNSFIRWPFMVEGIIIGIVAALISILIIGVSYDFLVEKILASSITNVIKTITLLPFEAMFGKILIVYLVLGVGIGAIGSGISMRKYLKV